MAKTSNDPAVAAARIEAIKKAWEPGMSARDLAAKMGMTREAIVGMFHRHREKLLPAKLQARPGPQKARTHIVRSKPAEGRPSRKKVAQDKASGGAVASAIQKINRIRAEGLPPMNYVEPEVPLDAPVSRQLPLVELTERTCKWPHGTGPFFFCGNEVTDHHAYCPYHGRLAGAGLYSPRYIKALNTNGRLR